MHGFPTSHGHRPTLLLPTALGAFFPSRTSKLSPFLLHKSFFNRPSLSLSMLMNLGTPSFCLHGSEAENNRSLEIIALHLTLRNCSDGEGALKRSRKSNLSVLITQSASISLRVFILESLVGGF